MNEEFLEDDATESNVTVVRNDQSDLEDAFPVEDAEVAKAREERIRLKSEELETAKKETTSKKYLVNSKSTSFLDNLNKFFREKVKWKFNEALGVEEALKASQREQKRMAKNKNATTTGALFTSTEILAINYFLSRFESEGAQDIGWFLEIAQPISDSLGQVKQDQDRFQRLEFELASLREGLEIATYPEDPVSEEEVTEGSDTTDEETQS